MISWNHLKTLPSVCSSVEFEFLFSSIAFHLSCFFYWTYLYFKQCIDRLTLRRDVLESFLTTKPALYSWTKPFFYQDEYQLFFTICIVEFRHCNLGKYFTYCHQVWILYFFCSVSNEPKTSFVSSGVTRYERLARAGGARSEQILRSGCSTSFMQAKLANSTTYTALYLYPRVENALHTKYLATAFFTAARSRNRTTITNRIFVPHDITSFPEWIGTRHPAGRRTTKIHRFEQLSSGSCEVLYTQTE